MEINYCLRISATRGKASIYVTNVVPAVEKFQLRFYELLRHRSNMPKSTKAKHENTPAAGLPYSRPGATNVFKFNTNLGQHILKNPGG